MSDASDLRLSCADLSIRVPGRALVENLALELEPGEILAMLGRNGAGKSLTLHTLAGLRSPDSGTVCLGGLPLQEAGRAAVARHLALLPQYTEDIFPTTVVDTVLIGRHPHVGRWRWESADDRAIARDALRRVDLGDLAERDVATLSGGERRRVAIAQVLAQRPDIYLLDEPGNHLDPQHQLEVLGLFRTLAGSGKTVVASLHDMNLAARYADRCLLLHGDGRWQIGPTESTLSCSSLGALYQTRIEELDWRGRRLFVAAGGSPQD